MYCVFQRELCIISRNGKIHTMHMRMNRRQKIRFQKEFFEEAGANLLTMKQMMDTLPNVCFYIKDLDGRIVSFNRRNCEVANLKDEFDAVGSRSDEIFPEVKSKVYVSQDQQVLNSGKPLHEIIHTHPVDGSMRVVHKSIHPVRTADGTRIIGTVCIYRQEDKPVRLIDWHGRIKNITSHINNNLTEPLTLQSLSLAANTTPSKLVRAFQKILGMTPAAYVMSTRINAARKLLEDTDKTISEIAQDCGFCDHSHFVHTFRRERGITPCEYRRRHRRIS